MVECQKGQTLQLTSWSCKCTVRSSPAASCLGAISLTDSRLKTYRSHSGCIHEQILYVGWSCDLGHGLLELLNSVLEVFRFDQV